MESCSCRKIWYGWALFNSSLQFRPSGKSKKCLGQICMPWENHAFLRACVWHPVTCRTCHCYQKCRSRNVFSDFSFVVGFVPKMSLRKWSCAVLSQILARLANLWLLCVTKISTKTKGCIGGNSAGVGSCMNLRPTGQPRLVWILVVLLFCYCVLKRKVKLSLTHVALCLKMKTATLKIGRLGIPLFAEGHCPYFWTGSHDRVPGAQCPWRLVKLQLFLRQTVVFAFYSSGVENQYFQPTLFPFFTRLMPLKPALPFEELLRCAK